jgi:triacylglycerol lipase
MYYLILIITIALLLIADIKFNLFVKKWIALILFLVLSHIVLICSLASRLTSSWKIPLLVLSIFTALYFFIRMAFYITPVKIKLNMRIRIMMGGRRIFLTSIAVVMLQIPLSILLALHNTFFHIETVILVSDITASYILTALLLFNGVIRIVLTSRRLGIVKRLLLLLCSWIPVVNIILGVWFCRIVKQEFIHEYETTEIQNMRASSHICEVKYPLLMLHGIGFRDYKYINYWGRIPALLIKNGAKVYYGHQQAWGTIEDNAAEIKQKLLDIISETGCKKVNIIAHSKGGLDARYLISTLGMKENVASLTTISTPHRGSELLTVLGKMKEKNYMKLCRIMNTYFKKLGDTNPDAYTSSRQLLPEYCEEFNKNNPDAEGIYYQSYASQMKAPTSHGLLMVPFAVMKWVSGNNDGLVNIESAKWGEFKGVFKSRKHRGISHGDLIDLMRQDYEGFNMAEEYVSIVSELKNKGY